MPACGMCRQVQCASVATDLALLGDGKPAEREERKMKNRQVTLGAGGAASPSGEDSSESNLVYT